MEKIEVSLTGSLMKLLMFFIVQALVYLILSKSSHVFSSSLSFKPARLSSFLRILASFSDFPQGFEQPSPVFEEFENSN
ncbi:hypothetical protein HRI_000687300 [Hibiscus trionum]|uniref:Uncharacterized protein n=1 Tax=Hibiscus trionum TaxID=183268 RepID=A0A9W7H6D0_HIBTR|nr:hypothetical protein HRI_000687300 [Hibiscus trionum]